MKDLIKRSWNTISGKNENVLLVCNAWILPLTFTFSYLLNVAFYYLGLASAEHPVRRYAFILGSVLFAVVCIWTFLHSLRHQKLSVVQWVFLSLIVVFFGLSFIFGLSTASTRSVMLRNAKTFCFFAAPAFLAGIVAAVRKTDDSFFGVLEKLSFFGLPAAAIYMTRALFNINSFAIERALGFLNYMSVAYSLMPMFLALLVQFSNGAPLPIPFTARHFKHSQLLRGIIIAIYWIALIATATRGMYVCVAVFCVLLVGSRLFRREPSKKAWLLSLALAAVLLFNMFIYAPPGMRAVSRMTGFVQNLLQGQFVTSDSEQDNLSDFLDDLIQANGGEQITNLPIDPSFTPDPDANVDVDVDVDTDANANTDANTTDGSIKITNRGTLYKLAFGEFVKNPLFGMGPGGYSVKYGLYPHNAFLEILCETGLVGCLIIFPLIFLALLKLGIAGWSDKNIWYIFIFMLTYILQINISGTVWNCPALLCALGYGLAMPLPKREKRLKSRR